MMRSSSAGKSGFSRTGETGGTIQNRIENYCRGIAAERQRPGRHLIENAAKREEVGARVQFFAARLLGRHVRNRADRCARTGQMFEFDGGRRCRSHVPHRASERVARHLRQSEVQNLGVAPLGDKNIGGLDVAVDDSFGVRGVKRISDLDAPATGSLRVPCGARRSGALASGRRGTP